MSKVDNLNDFLKDLADAIREVQGITAPINPQDFADIIRGFSSGSSGLVFPIYLYTESLGSDFRRRNADEISISIIDWYDSYRVSTSSGGHEMPAEILSGKLFIDDAEVTAMYFNPSLSRDALVIETDYDYGMSEPLRLIQYTPTLSVAKGTIDILENG